MRRFGYPLAAFAMMASAAHAQAATPRDTLLQAAFVTTDPAQAAAELAAALAACDAILARLPGDGEARLQRTLAIGYRAKLTHNRTDALETRRSLEAMIATHPADAELQLALGGWHASAIVQLGSMMARTVLGARRAEALTALDRAAQLGAGHASYPAMAALFRIALDASDTVTALRLAEAAVRAPATSSFDRMVQRRAAAILPALRAGHGADASAAAQRLLPFGGLRTR